MLGTASIFGLAGLTNDKGCASAEFNLIVAACLRKSMEVAELDLRLSFKLRSWLALIAIVGRYCQATGHQTLFHQRHPSRGCFLLFQDVSPTAECWQRIIHAEWLVSLCQPFPAPKWCVASIKTQLWQRNRGKSRHVLIRIAQNLALNVHGNCPENAMNDLCPLLEV